MIAFIFGFLLLGILLVALSAQKTYSYIPLRELKRRARQGDEVAKMLHEAASYGLNLRLLLWAIISLSAAASFWLLSIALPGWLTFVVLVFVLWLGFMWLPVSRLTSWGVRLVRLVTPLVVKLLRWTNPVLLRVSSLVEKYRPITVHTGLYERADLVELLRDQAAQADSRIAPEDLALAERAVTFSDQLVRDCMTPRRTVTALREDDSLGPIVLDELYASGHSRFPVYGDDEAIVGVLYLRDVRQSKQAASVAQRMHREVYYVHEDHSLRQVLDAFIKTKRHLFIVVNEFEEYVGIVTIEDVLEQIIGQPIVDEFDKYDDLRAVAAAGAKKDHEQHAKADHEPS